MTTTAIFKTKPMSHQLEAFNLMKGKPYYALFLEMGCGKTKIIIDEIAALFLEKKIDGVIIVAPKGVYKNWPNKEIIHHLCDEVMLKTKMLTWEYNHSKIYLDNLNELANHEGLSIFVVNIEALISDKSIKFINHFILKRKTYMVVDESTTIKNLKAKRTKALLSFREKILYRRILTGSPVTQGPLDLYAQTEFLKKECLGHKTYTTFRNYYTITKIVNMGRHKFEQVVSYKNLDTLKNLLSEFSFRKTKKECLDLPEKLYQKRFVALSENQKRMYNELKTTNKTQLNPQKDLLDLLKDIEINGEIALEDNKGLATVKNALTKLLRFHQIVCGHYRDDEGILHKIDDCNPRQEELMNILEETSSKVIIWANYKHDIMEIEKLIEKKYGKEALVTYWGDTPQDIRYENVNKFQTDDKCKYFLGQPTCGGRGITLTAANVVVYYSNSFSLEIRQQSEDRAHRIGQTNQVLYIDIVSPKTIDEKIVKALRNKLNIASIINNDNLNEWI